MKNSLTDIATILLGLFVPMKFLKVDVCTLNLVESYCICPTKAQYIYSYIYVYINNICFLKHSYMFRCLCVILRESLVMCAKVTKLDK